MQASRRQKGENKKKVPRSVLVSDGEAEKEIVDPFTNCAMIYEYEPSWPDLGQSSTKTVLALVFLSWSLEGTSTV